jgi:hypothetical protein
MFRKLALAVVLFAIVIGVSYLKTTRGEQRVSAVREANREMAQENIGLKKSVDSLQTEISDTAGRLSDSIQQLDNAYKSNIDSLTQLAASREEEIGKLDERLKAEQAAAKKAENPQTTRPKASRSGRKEVDTEAFNKRVIDYYQKSYVELPKDLTEYEYRVAVQEIRQETAEKFSITVSRLDELREQFELEY